MLIDFEFVKFHLDFVRYYSVVYLDYSRWFDPKNSNNKNIFLF